MNALHLLLKRGSLWLVAGIALAFIAQPAAAAFTYTLTEPNSAISPYPAPYGTVDVTRIDDTHALISATADNTGGFFYLFGDGGTLGLNTVGGDASLFGSVTGTQPGVGTPSAGAGPYSQGAAGNEDGFGKFNFTLDSFDGASHASSTISFEIVNNSSTPWTADDTVLTANSQGALVAGHIFVWDNPGYSGDAVATGFAANGGSTVIPEPTSMALCLAGIAFGGGAWWRRRRRLLAVA